MNSRRREIRSALQKYLKVACVIGPDKVTRVNSLI